MRLTAAVSRAVMVTRFALCDEVLDPEHKKGRGGHCVLFSIRYNSQVIHAVYRTPAAAALWRHMFIDVSGCPRVHNMAKRSKHRRTESSQSGEQMNKQADYGLFTSQIWTLYIRNVYV